MSLVLELALTVLVSQSVLTLATSDQRDTQVLTNQNTALYIIDQSQLLRRELGSELSSIIDTWRRYSGLSSVSTSRSGHRSPASAR